MLQDIKSEKIQLIDNFLPEYQFRPLKKLLLGNNFSWFYQPTIVYNSDQEGSSLPQLYYYFYDRIDGWSEDPHNYRNFLYPLIDKINPFNLVRIKANLTTKYTKNVLSGYHTDFDTKYELTTAIFYVNTTDAPTYFVDGSKVDCVANRFISFPSTFKHSGSFTTNSQNRVVINLNYFS